ncbi:Cytoskeleton associated protein 5 [Nowakowskiella sp. JEL0078]|nr:Cytoskeleton associated protein 5 [Nowakowskiella sp. JEL0078]
MAEAEIDFSTLSLPDKLSNKSWKARVLGYNELLAIFKAIDPDSPNADSEFKKYIDHLRPILKDSNAAALDTGLNVVLAYITNCPSALK